MESDLITTCDRKMYPDDRRNKLDEKLGKLQKRGIKMIKEINQKAFDVRTIVVLYDHVSVNYTVYVLLNQPDLS